MSLYVRFLVAISRGLIWEEETSAGAAADGFKEFFGGPLVRSDFISRRDLRNRFFLGRAWAKAPVVCLNGLGLKRFFFLGRDGFVMGGSFGSRGLLETTNGMTNPREPLPVYVPTIDKVPSMLSLTKVRLCANCLVSAKSQKPEHCFLTLE